MSGNTQKSSEPKIDIVSWESHRNELYAIRYQVFVVEQNVPVEMEQDEFDSISSHLLVRDPNGTPIATGRMLPDAHIGRLAVLKPWRNKGIGKAMMMRMMDLASQQGMESLELNAQTSAIRFYRELGFECEGRQFMEAGIPHQKMSKQITE